MKTHDRLLCASCVLIALLTLAGCGQKSNVQSPPKRSPSPSITKKPKPAVPADKDAAKTKAAKTASDTGTTDIATLFGLPKSPSPTALAPAKSAPAGKAAPTTPTPVNRPQAKQLLMVLQSAYRSASTIRVSGASDTITRQDGKVAGKIMGRKSTMTFKRPNKFLLSSPLDRTYSNGRTVYIYSVSTKQYAKSTKPNKVLETLVSQRLGLGVMGLTLGIDYTPAFSSIALLADKNVGGREMFVLSLKLKPGVSIPKGTSATQTLWIGKRDLGIYRNEVVLKMKPQPAKGLKGKLPKLIETRMVDVISTFEANIKLPDSTFEFKPPKGAKLIEPPKQVQLSGKPAPDFSFKWTDSSQKKLSDFKGGVVLLSFSALPQCEEYLPVLQSIYSENKDKLQVISVNLNRDTARVDQYLKKKGYSFPTVYATPEIANVATEGYGLRTIPTLIIIDSQGIVQGEMLGAASKKEIEAALGKVK